MFAKMPVIYVDTSLRDGAISSDFETKFTKVISDVLNKPMEVSIYAGSSVT